MLMIAQVDPLYLPIDQKPWREWLSRIPEVVQFATLIDDTSQYADLVLPTTTYLEQWDMTLPVPNLPFSQLGLQQPIVPPLNGARPIGDVLLQLATETGSPSSRKTQVLFRLHGNADETRSSLQGKEPPISRPFP